jgi:enamine deaminase RidA (YjgF/YER057c/UK114 family)
MLKKIFRRVRSVRDPHEPSAARTRLQRFAVRPEGWKPPVGYENGILVQAGGRHLFVAGQIAWNADQKLVGGGDMVRQFVQALDNVLVVVREAGGRPEEIVRMTVYVTDKKAYLEAARAIGEAWRPRLGRHYPAMALVQVADLLEEGALVEIEATAVIG